MVHQKYNCDEDESSTKNLVNMPPFFIRVLVYIK